MKAVSQTLVILSVLLLGAPVVAHATTCSDGWTSHSSGSGTCSHHGGIGFGGSRSGSHHSGMVSSGGSSGASVGEALFWVGAAGVVGVGFGVARLAKNGLPTPPGSLALGISSTSNFVAMFGLFEFGPQHLTLMPEVAIPMGVVGTMSTTIALVFGTHSRRQLLLGSAIGVIGLAELAGNIIRQVRYRRLLRANDTIELDEQERQLDERSHAQDAQVKFTFQADNQGARVGVVGSF